MKKSPKCYTERKKGTDHSAELSRVNRIKGQVEGIGKMIEERTYCPQIITQIQAIRSSLASLQAVLLKGHLEHCVKDGLRNSNGADAGKLFSELINIFKNTD